MKIKDIMSEGFETVTPDTLLNEVGQKMRKSNKGSVLVEDSSRLVGVITDRDIAIRCVAEAHHPAETTAKQIMTTELLYCQDTDEAEKVAEMMTNDMVRSLVVLDADKKMVGTVMLGDILIVRKARTTT